MLSQERHVCYLTAARISERCSVRPSRPSVCSCVVSQVTAVKAGFGLRALCAITFTDELNLTFECTRPTVQCFRARCIMPSVL